MDALERKTQEVILVLGAGIVGWMNEQRAKRALEYNKDAPIILSGGMGGFLGSHMKSTEAAQMQDIIARYSEGRRVIREDAARNTIENFENSKTLINYLSPKRVVIVTSRSHMPRAVTYAERILKGYEIVPFPTKPKWYDIKGQLCELGCFAYEYTKIPLENFIKKIKLAY